MAGQLIVSLDFELFWGMLDCSTLEAYGGNVMGGRGAIPRLLKLFEQYNIHATWATVGFLFGENYEDLKQYFPEEVLRPTYEDPRLDAYSWFENIGNNEEEAEFTECADDLNRLCGQVEAGAGDTVIALSDIADDGLFVEVKANYGKDMVVGLMKLNGMTVGAVANRSEIYGEDGKVAEKLGEELSVRGCEKAADFINFCDDNINHCRMWRQ